MCPRILGKFILVLGLAVASACAAPECPLGFAKVGENCIRLDAGAGFASTEAGVIASEQGNEAGTTAAGISMDGATMTTPSAQPGNDAGAAPGVDSGAAIVVPVQTSDAGPMTGSPNGDASADVECDQSTPCTAGYTCTRSKCVSMCDTMQCDPHSTCSLMGATPVCTCNAGYIAQTGSGGRVTCLEDKDCASLACNATSQSCEPGANGVRSCVCKPGYTGSNCQPVSCGPLSVDNGTVATGTGTFMATATYSCNTGYAKTGGTARTCGNDGKWSGTAARCEPHDCGKPAAIDHGTASVESGTTYPTGQVRYTCDAGFTLSGTATRMCTPSGWSGTAPQCQGCGDGKVTSGEDCELGVGGATWVTCSNCRKTAGTFRLCDPDPNFPCTGGNYCDAISNYCTPACTSVDQCPQPPANSGLRVSCAVGSGCILQGCSASVSCPSNLTCSSGFCSGPPL